MLTMISEFVLSAGSIGREIAERLADFALWVSACEEALGVQPGKAIAACRTNSAEARDLALEASPPLCADGRIGPRGLHRNSSRTSCAA